MIIQLWYILQYAIWHCTTALRLLGPLNTRSESHELLAQLGKNPVTVSVNVLRAKPLRSYRAGFFGWIKKQNMRRLLVQELALSPN